MNGFPTYSVPFVASMQRPLVAAITNPVAATGTVGRAMVEDCDAYARNPSRRRSRTRTEPKSDNYTENMREVDNPVRPDAG